MNIRHLSQFLAVLVVSAGCYPAIAEAQTGQLSAAHSRSTGKVGVSTTVKDWKASQADAMAKCAQGDVRDCAILPLSGNLPAKKPSCIAWAISAQGKYHPAQGYPSPPKERPEVKAKAACEAAKQGSCTNVYAFCPS
jgi:hypothetical protein